MTVIPSSPAKLEMTINHNDSSATKVLETQPKKYADEDKESFQEDKHREGVDRENAEFDKVDNDNSKDDKVEESSKDNSASETSEASVKSS